MLVNELPLRWVMIADEFGTDPTLCFSNTDLNDNAVTMLSKRVERGESECLGASADNPRAPYRS